MGINGGVNGDGSTRGSDGAVAGADVGGIGIVTVDPPSIAATRLTTSWLTKPRFFPDAA